MNDNGLQRSQRHQDLVKSNFQQVNVQIAQEKIYNFLVGIVKSWEPEEVLQEFNRLFIDCLNSKNLDGVPGIYAIFFDDKEQDFHNTIKRCCYILVNNWESKRKNQYVQELVDLFTKYQLEKGASSNPKLNICQRWLDNFINSRDYEELKIFASRHEEQVKGNWTRRYSSYLLLTQSLNKNNPKEQQEAAIKLSKQMKDKFKFDLAMYIARSQSASASPTNYKNPSILGDNVLRLIKTIIAKKGVYSYENIARLFVVQTQNQTLQQFKESIQKYLFFSVEPQASVGSLRQQLAEKLSSWKVERNEETITKDLFLRICNRVIDCLTTENSKQPAPLFILLLSQGHSLTLVILLLKTILISRNSRTHLEIRIACLISYYEKYPADECLWLIHFIEIFNIAFAIYAENVEYSLLKMKKDEEINHQQPSLDAYRVFSQLKAYTQE